MVIKQTRSAKSILWIWVLMLVGVTHGVWAASGPAGAVPFPPPLSSYGDSSWTDVLAILRHRVQVQPFNLWATAFFLAAIAHTFLVSTFRHWAHVLEDRHRIRHSGVKDRVCAPARLLHFLGEVEAVFGIWIIPLLVAMKLKVGPAFTSAYVNDGVNFTEPVFVVVIMAIASTRPILSLAERLLSRIAQLGGGTPTAWWTAILTAGTLLGSVITEPAAMTICASLLSRRFYLHGPNRLLAYATLGLLFVAISTGGTLTHFAAPPVLMVAAVWDWGLAFMLLNFGWKAAIGIGVAVVVHRALFRAELQRLDQVAAGAAPAADEEPIPRWVTLGHILFMVLAVLFAHHLHYLILLLLFFLAFVEITGEFQRDFNLRPPVLVGFFLAGLVIHGGLQQWWIEPILSRLPEWHLFAGALTLTAFNDNAAITYLCTLVPGLSDSLKYAAMAGAVTGGGLTVIANAPNPAGQAILKHHFRDGIGAGGLLAGALLPTLILSAAFMLMR